MSLRHLPIERVDESALQRLLADGVEESKHLDFKASVSLGSDAEKKEFLSDVTSFANSDGGDLVFGIGEDAAGKPATLTALGGFSLDATVLQMESLLRDGVQPRISGIAFRPVDLASGGLALVIRIPRSLSGPHMVTIKGTRRFCGRGSKGKHDLDVHQLREAFLTSSGVSDRLQQFRIERVSRIMRDDCGSNLFGSQRFVLHLLPIESLRDSNRFDARSLRRIRNEDLWPPGRWSSRGDAVRFDGLRFYSSVDQDQVGGYVHIFRSGMLEAVWAWTGNPQYRLLNHATVEAHLVDRIAGYLKGLKSLEFTPPIVIGYALIGFAGYTVGRIDEDSMRASQPIGENALLLPELVIESEQQSITSVMKPAFDQVWNACGFFGSPNYRLDGEWVGKQEF